MIKFEVGDIVTITGPKSLYRLTKLTGDKFTMHWIGTGDKDVKQSTMYTAAEMLSSGFKLYRKISKLEKAMK